MPRQIIKQPNGLYAIWSTVVDHFLTWDMSVEDVVKYFVDEEVERLSKGIRETCAKLDAGEKPYYQFTMTFKEACSTARHVYRGKDSEERKTLDEIIRDANTPVESEAEPK